MSNSSTEGNGATAEPTEGPASEATSAPKRRKSRKKRTRRTTQTEDDGPRGDDASGSDDRNARNGADDGGSSDDGSGAASDERPKKKRRSRRGRRKKTSAERDESQGPDASSDTETKSGRDSGSDGQAESASNSRSASSDDDRSSDDAKDDGEPKRRRRGTRGGRRRKKRSGSDDDSQDEQGAAQKKSDKRASKKQKSDEDDEGGRGRKKKRGRKKRSAKGGKQKRQPVAVEAIPGEDDDLPELAELPDDAERVSKGDSKKKRKTESAVKEVPRDETILVNAMDKLESRVAVVREKRINELFLEVNRVQSYVHNIYRGKVVNIESAIGAAFVDFGQGKNGFLHVSDVLPEYGDKNWNVNKLLEAREGPNDDLDLSGVESDDDAEKGKGGKKDKNGKGRGRKREGSRPAIGDLLKVGDRVVVQITKDAIGDKGPALTTYISIPGRFIVLMPSLEMVGVSRKIEDEKERKRLRKIMQSFEVPSAMGLIVRTAGVGKTKADLKRDMDYLLALWQNFSKRLLSGKTPCALYQENDLAIRTMRDMFTRRTDKVVVDDEAAYDSMVEFAEKLMPEHVERIEKHSGDRPIFHSFGVEQDYEKIFNRRVDLPSGGSIVIDQTEALVAIDVNSGRTRGDGAVFEDIALKTNLEAVAEIALQIKLRDLGGILVLDFIDMMRKSSRLAVERALRDAMSSDRARHKVGRISQFGLLELTRQRLGPGLSKLLYTTCLTCRGTGRQRTPEARAQGIIRRLGSALTQKGFTKVEVRSQPEVIEYLKGHCSRDLEGLSTEHKRELVLVEAPEQLEESVLRYLRADGREVRPGGRRKKR